jgi:hypothetical protein
MREHRYTTEQHYKGPAEVWADGTLRFEAEVRLTKRESAEEMQTLAGTETVRVQTTWDGRFRGAIQDDLRPLQVVGGVFELKLPDGSVGHVLLPNGRDLAYLQGIGDPPF